MNNRASIPENVKRRLLAESLGRCMNPSCQEELFSEQGDIIEKAHIDSYAESQDNSFENLIILCPNCHTNFDKNQQYSKDEVKNWKKIRQEELDQFFSQQFQSFKELEAQIKPLLIKNKTIYENYYLGDNKRFWEKYEHQILVNNKKIKGLLNKNISLLEKSEQRESNQSIIYEFMQHIDEFETTRGDKIKERKVLFPKKVNSIFGVEPIAEAKIMIQSLASLECLLQKLEQEGSLIDIDLISKDPKIIYTKDQERIALHLKDTPRLKQEYCNYKCFRKTGVRINSFLFYLKYLKNNNIEFCRQDKTQLSVIQVKGRTLIFLAKYTLSVADIIGLSPKKQTVIVNTDIWNSISEEAYKFAETININLRTGKDFFKKIHTI